MRRTTPPRPRSRALTVLLALLLTGGLGACGSAQAEPAGGLELRLGYYPNITHAAAIVGLQQGILARSLGGRVTLTTQVFNAGPAEVEAIFGGALDAGYVGPNPAINAFVKSHGALVRIVAGAASGGAGLVVRRGSGITSATDLRGKRLASPQLGNTQDVALRAYLAAHGIHTTAQGGGDASVTEADNSTILQLFQSGRVDGAWVPEPYLSRLVDDEGGTLLVDEATLWPGGRFPTTELIVATAFLKSHPDVVGRLVSANLDSIQWIHAHPAQARQVVADALARLTQKRLSDRVMADAWRRLTFTADPLAGALATEAAHAHDAGLVGAVDLHGIVDLRLLDEQLRDRGSPVVDSGGYGPQ
jgi:sulfonate transport system substrate-binding protein